MSLRISAIEVTEYELKCWIAVFVLLDDLLENATRLQRVLIVLMRCMLLDPYYIPQKQNAYARRHSIAGRSIPSQHTTEPTLHSWVDMRPLC